MTSQQEGHSKAKVIAFSNSPLTWKALPISLNFSWSSDSEKDTEHQNAHKVFSNLRRTRGDIQELRSFLHMVAALWRRRAIWPKAPHNFKPHQLSGGRVGKLENEHATSSRAYKAGTPLFSPHGCSSVEEAGHLAKSPSQL